MRMTGWILCLPLLASCSSTSSGPDTRPVQGDIGGPLAETVNGIAVPQALLEAVARARDLDLSKSEQRDQALTLLTDYVLLSQAAGQNNFFNDERFRADVEAARLQAVGNASLAQLQQQAPITDAVVKAEFDAQVARAGKFEYDFTQLLFENGDDAIKAEGDILAGKPFSAVYDQWKGKAKQAKAFSRVRADQIPEDLAKALAGLKNGESTKAPVKTNFGWHVVNLSIANPFTPPPFDQIKDSVRQTVLRKVGRERLQKLKETAKVEYPPGVTAPVPAKGEGKADIAKPKSALGADKAVETAERKE